MKTIIILMSICVAMCLSAKNGPFLPGRDETYCENPYVSNFGDTWKIIGDKFSIDGRILAFLNQYRYTSKIPHNTKLCVDVW